MGLHSYEEHLEHELLEARNELVRHHLDFQRISIVLDEWRNEGLKGDDACVQIQRIVG